MKIKVGDKLPSAEFFYLNDEKEVKKISTSDLFKDHKVIILGMPGAFTKVCSVKHLPGYVKNFDRYKEKGISKIVCIAVNDPNVMQAWGDNQKVDGKIFMAGDPFCKFTKSIGAEVDKSVKGLGIRSSRYTMLVENETVKIIKEEKETGHCEISAAENFLQGM